VNILYLDEKENLCAQLINLYCFRYLVGKSPVEKIRSKPMMPPPYSKVASPSNAKVATESCESADGIRSSWTQQTSCDILSAERFPQLTKSKNTPNKDVNRNHQHQKDFQSADQASSSRSSPRFSSTKSSSVSVPVSQNRQLFNNSVVVPKPPDSIPLHPKTDLVVKHTFCIHFHLDRH
jgi:hypothetical protein